MNELLWTNKPSVEDLLAALEECADGHKHVQRQKPPMEMAAYLVPNGIGDIVELSRAAIVTLSEMRPSDPIRMKYNLPKVKAGFDLIKSGKVEVVYFDPKEVLISPRLGWYMP